VGHRRADRHRHCRVWEARYIRRRPSPPGEGRVGGVSWRLRQRPPTTPTPAARVRAAEINADCVSIATKGGWRLRRGTRPSPECPSVTDTPRFPDVPQPGAWLSWTRQPSPSQGQLPPIVCFDLFSFQAISQAVAASRSHHSLRRLLRLLPDCNAQDMITKGACAIGKPPSALQHNPGTAVPNPLPASTSSRSPSIGAPKPWRSLATNFPTPRFPRHPQNPAVR